MSELPTKNVLVDALSRISKWFGEFPSTGRTWGDGTPMSYAAAYGSNGERDYMRQVASDALDAHAAEPTYTMQQAIDKIVGGLVLEWKDDGSKGRITQDWTAIRRGVMYRVIQFHDRIVCITPLVNIVVDSVLAGKDICLSEVKREVRAEIEKAVARGS